MTEAFIILGMHRSGTSCLTGCLRNYGLHLGMVSDSNPHNKKGNQENKDVFQLNEKLLNINNGNWRNPPISPIFWDDELASQRDQIISTYNAMPNPWGIKDPRMLLVYGFWEKHLPSHQLIGTFRHPLAVAKSLAARTHKNLYVSEEQALDLWRIYNEKLLALFQQQPFPVINFDINSSDYLGKVAMISNQYNLQAPQNNNFFDENLINQTHYTMADCPNQLKDLYLKLIEISLK